MEKPKQKGIILPDGPFKGVPVGFIYRITHTETGKVYIGQTSKIPNIRFDQHMYHGETYDPDKPKTYRSKLYAAMRKYGTEKFVPEVILTVPVQLLDDAEIMFIKHYDSVNNGYNITPGGASGIGYVSAEMRKENPDPWRKHEESKGLPQHVCYLPDDGNGFKGYGIIRHPLCKKKYFTLKHHPDLESAKSACLTFLEALVKEGKVYENSRTNVQYPKGISKIKGGFRVRLLVDPNRPRLDKAFCDSNESDEVQLQKAKDYIAEARFRYRMKIKDSDTPEKDPLDD